MGRDNDKRPSSKPAAAPAALEPPKAEDAAASTRAPLSPLPPRAASAAMLAAACIDEGILSLFLLSFSFICRITV
jgi:hypothetical protein